jgi:hypothetical protein
VYTRLTHRRVFVSIILCLLAVSIFIYPVSSSSGAIKVNSTSASAVGQRVQAGGTVNLYFGDVTWGGTEFYLLMSLDNNMQVSIPDIIFTPRFPITNLANMAQSKSFSDGSGSWTVGYNWVNGTIPQGLPVGNYSIKAFDEVTGTVAITDVFIIVYSVIYSSSLQISPSSGPGGVTTDFTGAGFPPSSTVTISYYDSGFGSWNALTTATANAQGGFIVFNQIPDLRKALGMGDLSEAYTRLSYRAEINGIVYCFADYNESSRGLKRVGSQTATGLYGNGTNLSSSVNLATGDTLAISGKYFHPGDVVYVRWDGQAVVGTVTGNQWLTAQVIGSSIVDSTGYFEVSAVIPSTANAGAHYISVEDSQAKVIVQIYVSMATLNLSPGSGPGGATVQFSGSRYPASTPITISYQDPTFSTWNQLGTAVSDSSGSIQFSTVMPDLRKALTGYDTYESSNSLQFRTEKGGTIYCYTIYNENARGLRTVGTSTASGLYGNGTNLASTVFVNPGNVITVSGKWFHVQDVVYIRWDGSAVVGTVAGSEWLNAQIIGSAIADASGYFSAAVTIPSAEVGAHFLSVEDSQAKVIIKVALGSSTPNPPPGGTPTSFDLGCASTTTYIGYNVAIKGNLTSGSTFIPNAQILINYSVNAGVSWLTLTTIYTDNFGQFSVSWMPSVSGSYLIRAVFNGNSQYAATTKTIALVSTPYSSQNVFSVSSNSTVSSLSFSSGNSELSFAVSGPSGTQGITDVNIAKSLMPNISNLKVYLDGALLPYTSTSTTDAWLIHFIYSHSTHSVIMDLASNPTPTASPAPTQAPTAPPQNNPTQSPTPTTSSTPEVTLSPSPSQQSTPTPSISEEPTQTPSAVPTATSVPSSTPTAPQFLSTPLVIGILAIVIVVVIVALFVVKRKR